MLVAVYFGRLGKTMVILSKVLCCMSDIWYSKPMFFFLFFYPGGTVLLKQVLRHCFIDLQGLKFWICD